MNCLPRAGAPVHVRDPRGGLTEELAEGRATNAVDAGVTCAARDVDALRVLAAAGVSSKRIYRGATAYNEA